MGFAQQKNDKLSRKDKLNLQDEGPGLETEESRKPKLIITVRKDGNRHIHWENEDDSVVTRDPHLDAILERLMAKREEESSEG